MVDDRWDVDHIIIELASMPDRVLAVVAQFPVEAHAWTPREWAECPGEHLTLVEHVCHLRDMEQEGFQVRLRRIATKKAPVLDSLDCYELARQRQYSRCDLRGALREFSCARLGTLLHIRALPQATWSREAVFGEMGLITGAALLDLLIAHDLQHLACLRWLGAKWHSRHLDR